MNIVHKANYFILLSNNMMNMAHEYINYSTTQ